MHFIFYVLCKAHWIAEMCYINKLALPWTPRTFLSPNAPRRPPPPLVLSPRPALTNMSPLHHLCNLDFSLFTETWLDNSGSTSLLIESAPPYFNSMNASPPDRKGGGGAAIFKDPFQCKQFSCGDSISSEYFCTVLKDTQKNPADNNLQTKYWWISSITSLSCFLTSRQMERF